MVAGLDAAGDVFDTTAEVDVWTLSDDELADVLERCERLAARQAELSMRLVREADARDLGRRLGAPSTAWLKHRLHRRPGDAKGRVDLANRLHAGDTAEGPVDWAANVGSAASDRAMPATAAALARGDVPVDRARVVATTMLGLTPLITSASSVRDAATIWHVPGCLHDLGQAESSPAAACPA
ncbi:MAG: hypothetical protein ACRDWI_18955 [Jiangellaceae bacterium]